jgi:hypothetical protein
MSDPVLVMGMHRSGTSFLIRALSFAGLWLGADSELSTVEGRAQVGNPKGNYESRRAIAINNAILARSGGSWANPPPRVLFEEADVLRMSDFTNELERGRPREFPRWGWKDPRTVITLEGWLSALRRPIFVVGSFRHPTAVARSLLARDRIPLEIGYALWKYYNGRLLEHLNRHSYLLVRFDVERPLLIETVVEICGKLGLSDAAQRIESWHDTALVRSRADSPELPPDPQIRALWQELSARYESQLRM